MCSLEHNFFQITKTINVLTNTFFAMLFVAVICFETMENQMTDGKQIFSKIDDFYANLGSYTMQIVEEVLKLDQKSTIDRLWQKDHTIWDEKPDEISNRLGWLDSPGIGSDEIKDLSDFAKDIKDAGFTKALLLGMGGSSLAPEVFKYTFGVTAGFVDLFVLDSTDPAAVLEAAKNLKFDETLFIVSTKSGGTIETISFLKYFYNACSRNLGMEKVGDHFIAITDPDSGLESMAKELKFRRIFLNDPNIGGRYSALSYFGLLPAALMGIDIDRLIKNSREMVLKCHESTLPEAGQNSAAWLGGILGGLAKIGVDKLTLFSSPSLKYMGAWIEQLIAESSGKNGQGILPVDLEEIGPPDEYLKDRVFVYLKLKGENSEMDSKVKGLEKAGFPVVYLIMEDLYSLGGDFFRWEIATALAAATMGINPFDQPDVESAKVRARQMMDDYKNDGELKEPPVTFKSNSLKIMSEQKSDNLNDLLKSFFSPLLKLSEFEENLPYVSIQAYMKPAEDTTSFLQDLRISLRKRFNVATTVGYGPRFLHSTGQLHKGDGGNGLYIQLIAEEGEDCSIPANPLSEESNISFRVLKRAQCLGDRQALLDAGRGVMTIDLGENSDKGLQLLKSNFR